MANSLRHPPVRGVPHQLVEVALSLVEIGEDLGDFLAGGEVKNMTTRQAADLLQVSRTFLVRLLDEGRIPCRKVGSHRRVRTEDILAYRRDTESRRRDALDELTAQDQKLGLQ